MGLALEMICDKQQRTKNEGKSARFMREKYSTCTKNDVQIPGSISEDQMCKVIF